MNYYLVNPWRIQMADESKPTEKEFSLEYVQELRREAASYRTKYKELEAQTSVLKELTSRNIKADPSWVKVQEGQSVKEAVDMLLESYPHLIVQDNNSRREIDEFKHINGDSHPQHRPTPKPQAPAPHPVGPKTDVETLLKERDYEAIKKDPKARAALRDQYRELLRAGSHQKDPTNY